MAEKSLLEQMLERLVNDDQAKAEELFHEYVVAKSREIYENLIEAEMTADDEEEEDPTNPKVKEESEVKGLWSGRTDAESGGTGAESEFSEACGGRVDRCA